MLGRTVSSLALAGTLAFLATGCGVDADSSTLTLAESKSPVQLLRNEVATRIPSMIIHGAVNEDFSEACGDDESIRSWHSSVRLDIGASDSTDAESIVNDLTASFEKDGWIPAPVLEGPEQKQAVYTKSGTAAEIHITAENGDEFEKTVLVSVFGPCVQTDGPESDEVTSLESRN